MLRKRVWIPILIVLLLVMGCSLFYGRKVAKQEPVKVYKPVEVEKPAPPKPPPPGETAESGHWHGDVWHTEPHLPPRPAPPDVFAKDAETRSLAFVSSNPLMPDPIPEPLRMPPEWQDWYYMEAYADPAKTEKYEQRLEELTRYIVRDYNPGRSLEKMWVEFIEAEKQLMADSPYDEENFGIPAPGGYRADWLYQQIWNFPEVFEIVLSEGKESPMWVNVFHIDMGFLEPDWNVFQLPDGREFRTKEKYRYKFVQGYDEETGSYRSSYGFAYGDVQNAETITVDLDTISETELESIQGYNYRINPYTGKTIFR